MTFNFKGGPNLGAGLNFAGGPGINKMADPLADVEYTDDLAQDSVAELTALEQAYRDRAKAEANRFQQATDSEYWFAVCFKNRDEKEAFLAAAGLSHLGDKYLDGKAVAKTLNIK